MPLEKLMQLLLGEEFEAHMRIHKIQMKLKQQDLDRLTALSHPLLFLRFVDWFKLKKASIWV